MKFSRRREAENKIGWLLERELEKAFFASKCEFYNRRNTRETQALPVMGEVFEQCQQGGEEAWTGMRHKRTM